MILPYFKYNGRVFFRRADGAPDILLAQDWDSPPYAIAATLGFKLVPASYMET